MIADHESTEKYFLKPIGFVRSELKRIEDCPLQGTENAPEAWLEIEPVYLAGLDDLAIGTNVVLLTWFHKANRDVIKCYMRNHFDSPPVGVFNTRSPDRPNPVGLHIVKVLDITEGKIKVFPLEALDGTPLIDIKPFIKNGQ